MITLSKQSGLGDALFVGGYDLSGDTQSLGAIGGGPAVLDVTGINKSAYERIGGIRDGRIEWASYFNDASSRAHPVLKTLPTSDVHVMYCRGTTLGSPAASMISKQINYDGSRGDDGAFTFALQSQANGYGLEWGRLLTAGIRTDTAATNGSSVDFSADQIGNLNAQAYLQVTAFTGTDATIKIQTSSDNGAVDPFADRISFTQVTAGPQTQRATMTSPATQLMERYARVVTTTTGGFTSLSFVVMVVVNAVEVVF